MSLLLVACNGGGGADAPAHLLPNTPLLAPRNWFSIQGYAGDVFSVGLASPFGVPQKISGLGFFLRPTLSPDEKELYYHWKNPVTNKFELYRMTRL